MDKPGPVENTRDRVLISKIGLLSLPPKLEKALSGLLIAIVKAGSGRSESLHELNSSDERFVITWPTVGCTQSDGGLHYALRLCSSPRCGGLVQESVPMLAATVSAWRRYLVRLR